MLAGAEGSVLQRHFDATQMTCVLAELTHAAGVYWGAGGLVHEPAAFVAEAGGMSFDAIPLHLWVDLRIEPTSPGAFRLFTTGMRALGHQELEVEETSLAPAELLDLAHSIAHYILASDVRIQDGETIGRSAEEKIQVTHEPSMFPARGDVLKLHLPTAK